jgi:hypothetical protein
MIASLAAVGMSGNHPIEVICHRFPVLICDPAEGSTRPPIQDHQNRPEEAPVRLKALSGSG